ncbi:MAG: dual specificity protein phosphatase family protein [Micropruina sp.]|nr:dual specificity protein phosphatase family protein [Micropruina sp.]
MNALPTFEHVDADFVTERLAVGGGLADDPRRARRQIDELVARGITHIADLRYEWSDAELVAQYAPQISYLHHPVEDMGQTIPGEYFQTLIDWTEAALAHPRTKLLVHCHAGVNRGPSGAFAVLLAQGWEVAPALDAIRAVRPIAWIDYADDAVEWHLSAADPADRAAAHDAVTQWRWRNQLPFNEVIRQTRPD